MDPNKTLEDIMEFIKDIEEEEVYTQFGTDEGKYNYIQEKALQLAEAITYLNEWMEKGGALPDKWKSKKRHFTF